MSIRMYRKSPMIKFHKLFTVMFCRRSSSWSQVLVAVPVSTGPPAKWPPTIAVIFLFSKACKRNQGTTYGAIYCVPMIPFSKIKLSSPAAGYSTLSNRDHKRMVLYLHSFLHTCCVVLTRMTVLYILYLTHLITPFLAEKSDVCGLGTSRTAFAHFIGQTVESVCEWVCWLVSRSVC